jgi:hypothetical protein
LGYKQGQQIEPKLSSKGSSQGGFFLNPKQEKGAERAVTKGSGQEGKT